MDRAPDEQSEGAAFALGAGQFILVNVDMVLRGDRASITAAASSLVLVAIWAGLAAVYWTGTSHEAPRSSAGRTEQWQFPPKRIKPSTLLSDAAHRLLLRQDSHLEWRKLVLSPQGELPLSGSPDRLDE